MNPRFPLACAVALALSGCASTDTSPYWRSTAAAGQRADFAVDNQACGAAASRVQPTARADQLPGGVVAPRNRIDAPPRPWTSAVAENAYMECMAGRGWVVARR